MSYPPAQQPGGWSDPSWPSQPQPPQSGAPYDPTPPPVSGGQPYGGYGYQSYGSPTPAGQPTNGMAIASLVCSLAGLVTCGLSSPIGAILGHVARRQIRERGEGGDGMALAGIVVGWILTALAVIGCGVYVVFFVWLVNQDPSQLNGNNLDYFGGALRALL